MQDKFVTGVNYWPARKAMYWWKAFDAAEVDRDFALLNACGIQTIRIFLTWEDFQPEPEQINRSRLDSLLITADLAYAHHLNLMPTFFCGHMSGVNWIPPLGVKARAAAPAFSGIQPGKIKSPSYTQFLSGCGYHTGSTTANPKGMLFPTRTPRGDRLRSGQRTLQLLHPSRSQNWATLASGNG